MTKTFEEVLEEMLTALDTVATEIKMPDDLHTYKQVNGLDKRVCRLALESYKEWKASQTVKSKPPEDML